MKRILFILALVMSAMSAMAQENVRVTTKDGLVMTGTFINGTNTTYTIKCDDDIRPFIINKYGTDTITFQINNISEVAMYGKVLVPHNGVLTAIKSQKEKTKQDNIIGPTDPNYAIGKALKSTGTFAMGVGIPCLVTGTILLATGKIMQNDIKNIDIAKSNTASNLQGAGYVLLPMGAALTIVGIPLHAHGKKIMTMNFNYTGNGVGVGVEF